MTTHKSLFQLINEQIDKRVTFSTSSDYKNQLDRVSNTPSGGRYSASVGEIVTSIETLLRETLPSTIDEGLEVTETSPISDKVNISLGKGTAGGQLFELDAAVNNLIIPFDDVTQLFYITLSEEGLNVENSYKKSDLTIAKIVVPKPGTTAYIQNNKDDGWNAYIVNLKEYKLYGFRDRFEEDTIELLRNNISPILADNIIGNIRLNEDLKITNTQGSLELNSDSLQLYDTDDNILAKFGQKGVFLYDENGKELAKFTGTEGRVGNMRLLPNSIQSSNFSSGALGSGFQIKDSGDAEFGNIRARGKITSSVFEYDSVSSVGGNLLVTNGDVLDIDMTALDASTLTITGDTTFAVGDILRIKDGTNDEWLEVTNIASAPTYTVTRDKNSDYSMDTNPIWKKGTAIINYKQSGDGLIYLTASDPNSPYINVLTHTGSPWDSTSTKVRLGNLNGFLGYADDLYGIAIGETNSYLKYDSTNGLKIKGDITITGGNASVTFYQAVEPGSSGDINVPKDGDMWIDTDDDNTTYIYDSDSWNEISSAGITDNNGMIDTATTPDGEGLYLGADYLGYYDSSNWKTYMDSSGNFYLGGSSGDLQWNGSTLAITGSITATSTIGGLLASSIAGWSHSSDTTSIDGGDIYAGSSITIGSGGLLQIGQTAYDTGTGFWVGDDSGTYKLSIGKDSGNKLTWNGTNLAVTGAINATSGNFTGTVNVGAAGKVYLDGANEVIKVYDSSSNLRVEIGLLS